MKHGPNWRGGRVFSRGYVRVYMPEHPRAGRRGYVLEHILVAEKALGKPLPQRAQVHHVNKVRSDNRPSNLVICENGAYHLLLHARMRALEKCGNPNWRPCVFCGEYDDTANMKTRQEGKPASFTHPLCERNYYRARNGLPPIVEGPAVFPKVNGVPCPHCDGTGVAPVSAHKLTKRQAQYLDFIRSYRDEHGYSPSYEEIADGVGVKSLATVHELIHKLCDMGFLVVDPNCHRSIRLAGGEVVELRRAS